MGLLPVLALDSLIISMGEGWEMHQCCSGGGFAGFLQMGDLLLG